MAKRRPPDANALRGGPHADEPEREHPPERPELSTRHRATLGRIFERPTRADIPWRDVERLFVALGGTVTQGKGSRRRVRLGDRRAVFHEPHPERATDKGAVEDVRGFLLSAGVRP
jgi:hypothetical protein